MPPLLLLLPVPGVLLAVFAIVGYLIVVTEQHHALADGYSDTKKRIYAVSANRVGWLVAAQMGAVAFGLFLRVLIGT